MPRRHPSSAAPACLLLLGALAGCSPGDSPDSRPLEGFTAPPGRPSGAKVRVLNAYASAAGEPVSLDIYPRTIMAEGEKPLLSVPYGTLSPFFDPTVADEQGNMTLVAYPSGQRQTPGGHLVLSWTATLRGGEAITYFLTAGKDVDGEGRRRGSLYTYDHRVSGDEPRPAPGKGLLMLHGAALYDALDAPNSAAFYFSAGRGCAKSYYEEADAPGAQPIAQMGGPFYQLDPGAVTGSIHEVPAQSAEPPDCRTPPLLADLPLSMEAGQRAILFVYAPKGRDFRTLFVPLTQ
jgi:hypothetical protein